MAPTPRRVDVRAAGLFAFRLFYGLCYEFFFEDFTQIFLIGLRAYAGGRWPYFGADVVWTQSQIPGALQGLLVAVPLMVAPYPEAPFVLLNLRSRWRTLGAARLVHLPAAARSCRRGSSGDG